MRKALGMALLTVLLFSASAMAFEYYLSDRDAYWILQDQTVGYRVNIPAEAAVYVETKRFGERMVDISVSENGPMLTVGGIKGTGLSVNTVRTALIDYWGRLLSGTRVDNNNPNLTTSKGISANFYSITGTSPTGQSVMVRVIIYQRGKDIAYITYTLEAGQYAGDIRQYWIEAVNSFEWI